MTTDQLERLLNDLESDRVERKASLSEPDKIRQKYKGSIVSLQRWLEQSLRKRSLSCREPESAQLY